METREEPSAAALRVFGHEPTIEDWRYVGRWAYAASWLSDDYPTAVELARGRLSGAAEAATAAALTAARGDSEMYRLVGAIARLPEAFQSGRGPFAEAVERAIDAMAERLMRDGEALRTQTHWERTKIAPRYVLETFHAGLLDVGSDRHVMLREAARELDDVLLTARDACPALRTLRLFLQAALPQDEAGFSGAMPPGAEDEPMATFGRWLVADLALQARRGSAYEAAWAAAARSSKDPLSRILAWLTSGTMLPNGVPEGITEDPWAVILALAMITEPEHASAVMECGALAQTALRTKAVRSVAQWAAQAARVESLERDLEIAVLASYEAREGHREFDSVANLDLFASWNAIQASEESRSKLRSAVERSLAAETARRREAVRQAKAALDTVRATYESTLEAAREKRDLPALKPPPDVDDANAQRGCLYGFGAGAAVMATYIVLGIVMGTNGLIERLGPVVIGIASLPVAAAILAQVAIGLRRAAATAEVNRRRSLASADYERARQRAERTHGPALIDARIAFEDAEESLAAFEKHLTSDLTKVA